MADDPKKAIVKSTRLAVELGIDLQIEIPGVLEKFRSELIGMAPDEYIIARMPQVVDAEYEKKCSDSIGSNVVVRYIYRGTVFGFNAKLIGIVAKPVKFMIINYPKSIVEHNMRQSERISCIFPGKMRIDTFSFAVNIMDISVTGCKIVMIQPDEYAERELANVKTKELKTVLTFNLPGETGATTIDGICKNVIKNPSKYSVGIEFTDMSKVVVGKIRGFVKEANALQW
ncbi:MAG: flagellar brake domain-containing protein [Candidatus Anammoxibacter sp.]